MTIAPTRKCEGVLGDKRRVVEESLDDIRVPSKHCKGIKGQHESIEGERYIHTIRIE